MFSTVGYPTRPRSGLVAFPPARSLDRRWGDARLRVANESPLGGRRTDGSAVFGCVATPVSNHRVVMFVKYDGDNSKVFLYKHAAAGDR
jgi:hypothetical protein